MFASLLALAASVAVVSAQTMPTELYNGFNKYVAAAKNSDDCAYYATDVQQLQAGYGYMFWNPFPCNSQDSNSTGTALNMVGCTGRLNFTTYLNYYLSANNAIAPGVNASFPNGNGVWQYYQSLTSAFRAMPPSNFNQHFQVRNCMFCKLVDSFAANFDPFCPQEICTRYGLNPSRCLSDNPSGETVGMGLTSIAPVMATTWDVDTEYDILFSVYGVSNTAPYVGMPLGTQAENCPSGAATRGLDGMPTGFTFQPNYQWLKTHLNQTWIYLKNGTVVHPECALINPNGGPTERVVIYCGRDLGNESNPPVAIAIDGPVQMSNGQYTTTTRMSVKVGTLNQGSLMFSAERYTKDHSLYNSFFQFHPTLNKDPCDNTTTKQVIMTSWTKGLRQTHPSLVAFPANVRWSMAAQIAGVAVGLEDGTIIRNNPNKLQIKDDDDDGFLHICLSTKTKAINVTFAQGLFYDPRNTMNVRQFAQISEPISLYAPYPIVNPTAVATPAACIVGGTPCV